ncbi:hypothetical protein DL96DRAFT_500483 [Flagelloscypha sp. PMI_526]|nr:hypothetical protein DL96DRAFT_500483 [Flagelloscypha sp. PMI_526]
MGTPKPGTIQHPELEHIYISRTRAQRFWRNWVVPIAWLLGITLAFTSYNIGAGALGRFMLDHFRLWNRVIPLDTPKLDRHAELIAALLASWLSSPVAIGLLLILHFGVDRWLRRIELKFRFLDHISTVVVVVLLSEWSLLLVAGAMLHPRFQYVDPVSLLGIYCFGSLLLIPPLGSLVGIGCRAWQNRRR